MRCQSRGSKQARRKRNAGIALVSVLWLVLLLSGLAATVAYVARVNALLARRSLELAEAQAAADAAIVNTISRLTAQQINRQQPLGVLDTWEFGSVPVTITVSAEAGRIDVNAASQQLLLAFLQAHGVSAASASDLLAQLRSRPRPLERTEELRQIPGWQEQDLRCWLGSFTVYSGRPDVTVSDAPPGVLTALRWLAATGGTTAAPVTASPARSVLGEVVRIRVSVRVGEANTTSEWIGRLTGDLSRPMLTMRWDHDAAGASSESCRAGKDRPVPDTV